MIRNWRLNTDKVTSLADSRTSLVTQMVKLLLTMWETRLRSLCWEEMEMAPHSSTLAWKIPWMEEYGRLQSMGSQRIGHNWATKYFSLSSRICKCGIQGCCPTSCVSLFHYEDFFLSSLKARAKSYYHGNTRPAQSLEQSRNSANEWVNEQISSGPKLASITSSLGRFRRV